MPNQPRVCCSIRGRGSNRTGTEKSGHLSTATQQNLCPQWDTPTFDAEIFSKGAYTLYMGNDSTCVVYVARHVSRMRCCRHGMKKNPPLDPLPIQLRLSPNCYTGLSTLTRRALVACNSIVQASPLQNVDHLSQN